MLPRRLACGLALLFLPLAVQAQSLASQTTWVNDHAQLVIQSTDGEGRITGTPIQSWTGIVREGQLLVEFLALRKEGGQTEILKGSDRYRWQ